MQVGFSVIGSERGAEFRVLGRDPGDPRSLVSFCRFADHAAILLGRLHYRHELLAELGPQLPEGLARECQEQDAALALAVYRCRGRDGVAGLEGDFSVAVWDGREKCLLASRDPLGGYPLFWTEAGGAVALSTRLQPLLVLRPGRSLDLDYLADYLMLPFRSVPELPNERSVYQGIRRLPAGTVLSVRLPGGPVERHRYWDWLERRVDPGTDRLEEVGARYGALLRGAVRERLHGPIAAHLSGGMDSTSVALIARACPESDHEATFMDCCGSSRLKKTRHSPGVGRDGGRGQGVALGRKRGSPGEIAGCAGFSDQRQFSHHFKGHAGATPDARKNRLTGRKPRQDTPERPPYHS
jgi:asparagine synthase (glutamine-hydrolysing)